MRVIASINSRKLSINDPLSRLLMLKVYEFYDSLEGGTLILKQIIRSDLLSHYCEALRNAYPNELEMCIYENGEFYGYV
ncbi:hypothetical protein AHIS1_p045 [Acaryochloris phage A-HIS1]|nr:hypothetical protein AHIS1_p045 [Acaryochloris phage A-HIS1]